MAKTEGGGCHCSDITQPHSNANIPTSCNRNDQGGNGVSLANNQG